MSGKKRPHDTKSGNAPSRLSKIQKKESAPEAHSRIYTDEQGPDFFQWLLKVSQTEFFSKYFEKSHLVASHGSASYFAAGRLFPKVDWTTERMVETATKHEIHFGTDISVVRFDPVLKQRVTYKSTGVCDAEELRDCMKNGWSVRFLRPHEFIESNSAFISTMEERFNCYCGLNSYWTPANSQGFAPHFDDVDVFLLQIEGEKEWRLYDPLDEVGVLTRHSSEDYVPEQFPKPKHALTLRPGDVLYMPRGMVHQGRTTAATHSLHVTFSANQMNSWADFFLRMTRHTIEVLSANNLEWRRAVPRDLLQVIGAVHHPDFRQGFSLDDALTPEQVKAREKLRQQYQSEIRRKLSEVSLLLVDETNMDVCADEYAKSAIAKMQPLPVTAAKKKMLAEKKQKETAANASDEDEDVMDIPPDAKIRLTRRNAARLLLNVEGEAQVYHCAENSPVCLQTEVGELRFESDFAPAIATLLTVYPKWVRVCDLPFPSFSEEEVIEENQCLLVESCIGAGILEMETK